MPKENRVYTSLIKSCEQNHGMEKKSDAIVRSIWLS